MDCGGMSAHPVGVKKKERQSSNNFDLLSPLFLMVTDCVWYCYKIGILYYLYFWYLHYMSIYKWDKKCTMMYFFFFSIHNDLNWKMCLLVWHKDECCYLGFSTQSISQCVYSPLSHPPDLSSSHFLHSPCAHTNSYSSPDSTQSVLYLTLIKPFLPSTS